MNHQAGRSSEEVRTRFWANAKKDLFTQAGFVILHLVIFAVLPPWGYLLVGGVVSCLVFGYLTGREGKASSLWFTPLSTFHAWQTLCLGLAPVCMAFEIRDGSAVNFATARIEPAYVASGYLLSVCATFPFCLGMFFSRPAPDPPLGELSDKQLFAGFTQYAILGLIGAAVMLFPNLTVKISASLSLLYFAAHSAAIALALTPAERLRCSRATLGVIIFGLTAVIFALSFRASSKTYLMLACTPAMVYVVASKHLRKYVPVAIFVAVFCYLTIVAPSVNGGRNLKNVLKLSSTEATWEGFKRYSPLMTGQFDANFYQKEFQAYYFRQFESANVGFFQGEVERNGYLNGATFDNLKYAFIPRIFWPDKPMVTRGAWFASYMGYAPRQEDAAMSLGLGPVGELYWNFGYLGVGLGMLLLGFMLGGLWRLAGTDPRMSPISMLLYVSLTFQVITLPEASTTFVAVILMFIVFGVLRLISKPMHGRYSSQVSFPRVSLDARPGS